MEVLRQKGLAKYKYMFNTIQESIMVLTQDNISFLNSQATKLFMDLKCKEQPSLDLLKEEFFVNGFIDERLFYIYQTNS